MSEIVVTEKGILNPFTGELVPRDDLPAIAGAMEMLRERRNSINAVLSEFTQAVILQSVLAGTKTIHLDDCTLTVSADHEIEWNHEMLYNELTNAGLPPQRVTELVQITVSYKVNASVAKQIAGANPAYRQIIEAAQTKVPKTQYVTVRRGS